LKSSKSARNVVGEVGIIVVASVDIGIVIVTSVGANSSANSVDVEMMEDNALILEDDTLVSGSGSTTLHAFSPYKVVLSLNDHRVQF